MHLAQADQAKISNKHWMIIAKIMVDQLNAKTQKDGSSQAQELGFSVKIEDFMHEQEESFKTFQDQIEKVDNFETATVSNFHPQKLASEELKGQDKQVYINEILFAFQSSAPGSDEKAIKLILKSEHFSNLNSQIGKSYIPELTQQLFRRSESEENGNGIVKMKVEAISRIAKQFPAEFFQ